MSERLAELHADPRHYTCREIAGMLSREFKKRVTRCAVIGKAHRMALPFRALPIVEKKPRKQKRKYSPRTRVVEAPPRPPRIEHNGVLTIYQTGYGDCRFPIGEFPFVYCGKEQIEGRPYCAEHYAVTHIEARKVWA